MIEENTRSAKTDREIDRRVKHPKTGVITNVYEHTEVDDNWNFHVDVRINEETHPRKVPVTTGVPELISPPRTDNGDGDGDLALVQYIKGSDGYTPIVTDIVYNNEDRPPLGEEGIVRLRRNTLYAEVASDGSYARLAKKTDGDDAEPDLVIELDESGTIKLGNPNGDLQPVARKGDEVQVSIPDGGTGTGTITEGSSNVEST